MDERWFGIAPVSAEAPASAQQAVSEMLFRGGKSGAQEALTEEAHDDKRTPQERFWRAAKQGNLAMLHALEEEAEEEEEEELLEVERPDPETGWCALHFAAGEAGSAAATTLLLDTFGADPNTRTSEFLGLRSPLHVAASRGHYQCCDVLLKRNARADARAADGRTALHCAAAAASGPTVRLLARVTKNVDCRDDNGQAPLHLACIEASPDCVEALLRFGADPRSHDASGRSPFDLLMKVSHSHSQDATKVAKLLGEDLPEPPTTTTTITEALPPRPPRGGSSSSEDCCEKSPAAPSAAAAGNVARGIS